MNKEALLNIINTSIDAYISGAAIAGESAELSEVRKELKSKNIRCNYAETELDLEKMRTERLRFVLTQAANMVKEMGWSQYLVKDGNDDTGWVDNKHKSLYDFIQKGII